MTDEATSPLRRRMIEDMTIRKLAPKTQQGYIRTIKDFAVFLGRGRPDPPAGSCSTFNRGAGVYPR
jgi:Phage integrase, N-terminal SAM-like domain